MEISCNYYPYKRISYIKCSFLLRSSVFSFCLSWACSSKSWGAKAPLAYWLRRPWESRLNWVFFPKQVGKVQQPCLSLESGFPHNLIWLVNFPLQQEHSLRQKREILKKIGKNWGASPRLRRPCIVTLNPEVSQLGSLSTP